MHQESSRRKVRPTQHKAGSANRRTFYGQIGTAAAYRLENPKINLIFAARSFTAGRHFCDPPPSAPTPPHISGNSGCQGELQ